MGRLPLWCLGVGKPEFTDPFQCGPENQEAEKSTCKMRCLLEELRREGRALP